MVGDPAMASSLPAITSSGLSGRPSFTMEAIADCKLLSRPCSATGVREKGKVLGQYQRLGVVSSSVCRRRKSSNRIVRGCVVDRA